MQMKEEYLQRVVTEVEELADRVAQLKARIAKQKVSVSVQFNAELEYVRNRFADFRKCIEELEEVGEDHVEEAHAAAELAWSDLLHAVEALLAALP